MKGRPLILIFLFLAVLLFFIFPVSADTGVFSWGGSFSDDESKGGSTQSYMNDEIGSIIVPDVGGIHTIGSVSWRFNQGQIEGSMPHSSYWVQVNYKIGSDVVGTGSYGYIKDEPNNEVVIHAIFYDCDLSDYSGKQVLTLDWVSESLEIRAKASSNVPTTSTMAYLGLYADGVKIPATDYYVSDATSVHRVSYSYSFTNEYEYEGVSGNLYFLLDRDSNTRLKAIINNSDREIVNESSYSWTLMATDLEIYEPDIINNTWDVKVENVYGDINEAEITIVVSSSGGIEFNQTSYIDPENIEVEWDITGFNIEAHNYKFQMTATLDNNVDSNFWEASGNWNTTTYISSATGAAVFDLLAEWYDSLPIWIRAELWVQDKSTGTWTKLDSTPAVVYHEGVVPGQIWTDKSNYNVTELVEIWYTTNVAENYIAVEEPHSLWSTHDVPVGTYSFLYELSTSAVGNTTIYLFENSELVDHVTISVSSESGDDAYAAWMKDYYYEGETASFYYYSSNASAQITVYDGADIVVFGPATTQLGYHNGRVNTANTNPGTFLLSLYHNGTYYNDTMIFESADSWVRFDSSKYYVGDTINIEYYLADPTHQISMWDAHLGLVIRFTTNYGVLVPGSMETVPFTLSEDNEYSYDVPGKLSSGDLALGYWTVFIEERNGVLGDSWDEAYVCYATDDDDGSYGSDASNEMIELFFSPEGLFMMFTVALTMMGLVAAKHPAGGGAGATVGVGFGTYFNVLPVWMLMLTVILLVVMAGVSIAVYYKGK